MPGTNMTSGLRLLGMDVLTDYPPLAQLLNSQVNDPSDNRESIIGFDESFPGLIEAIVDGCRELAHKRLQPTLVIYFNFRVQVWALRFFDADPSSVRRCIPAGVVVEDVNYTVPGVIRENDGTTGQ